MSQSFRRLPASSSVAGFRGARVPDSNRQSNERSFTSNASLRQLPRSRTPRSFSVTEEPSTRRRLLARPWRPLVLGRDDACRAAWPLPRGHPPPHAPSCERLQPRESPTDRVGGGGRRHRHEGRRNVARASTAVRGRGHDGFLHQSRAGDRALARGGAQVLPESPDCGPRTTGGFRPRGRPRARGVDSPCYLITTRPLRWSRPRRPRCSLTWTTPPASPLT